MSLRETEALAFSTTLKVLYIVKLAALLTVKVAFADRVLYRVAILEMATVNVAELDSVL